MIRFARSPGARAALAMLFLTGSIPLPTRASGATSAAEGSLRAFAGTDSTGQSGPTAPSTTSRVESPQPNPAGQPVASLDDARELIKVGDYDGAIQILKATIERERQQIPVLRDAYLLLIKTHVYVGNEFKSKPQGRTNSNLQYQEARRLIGECLRTRELRHVRPDPPSEYPEEMVRFFAEIRGQIFGSFRIVSLEPRDAVVLLDSDTLSALPPDSLLGDVDIAIGPHLVVVRSKGYKDLTEEIAISANSTLERSYRLNRKHGAGWYATMGAGALAVVGGVVALATGGGSTEPPPPEPLPGAPNPPPNP
jgi:hypothetical protein